MDYDSLEDMVEAISNDINTASGTGTNAFLPTPETIEYEGDEYRLWECYTNFADSWNFAHLYGLTSLNLSYADLYANSMAADIDNRYSPFIAVDSNDSFDPAEYTEDLGERYTLVCPKYIMHSQTPMNPTHSTEFSELYIDDFIDYGIFNDIARYYQDAETVGEWVDWALDNDSDSITLYEDTGETVEYDGKIYRIFVDDYNYGGLVDADLTYQDLYPTSVKADSRNINNFTSPFAALYDYNSEEIQYEGMEGLYKHSTLIAVR